MTQAQQAAQPDLGFLRIYQIIGDAKRGIAPLIPVSAASWWRGCKDGRYPKGLKLSKGVTVWRRAEILALIAQAGPE
jgi:prophage regulatory protein